VSVNILFLEGWGDSPPPFPNTTPSRNTGKLNTAHPFGHLLSVLGYLTMEVMQIRRDLSRALYTRVEEAGSSKLGKFMQP